MELQNIECQLKQAQIERYVAGDVLPESDLQLLQAHLENCGDCAAFAEQQKLSLEAAIQSPAAKKSKKKAAEPESVPAAFAADPKAPEPDFGPLEAKIADLELPDDAELDALLRSESETTVTEEPRAEEAVVAAQELDPKKQQLAEFFRKNLKTLALSGSLALVLATMSLFAKNPTSLFGEKAIAAATPKTNEAKPPEPKKEEEANARDDDPLPLTDEMIPEAQPEPEKAPTKEPEPQAARPKLKANQFVVAKRTSPIRPAPSKKPERNLPSPKKSYGSVRVYDATGKPIHP